LDAQLQRLQLPHIQSHYQALATKAAEQQRSHLDYLEQLVEGGHDAGEPQHRAAHQERALPRAQIPP
jgi:DNA replication protein DnaC